MDIPDAALPPLDRLALVVVDVQQAFDDAGYWGERDNPECEANIARLLDAWRTGGRPVVFVRHDSTEPGSPLRPDQPGNAFKPLLSGSPDLLVTKSVNSSFHGTPDLDAWLRERALDGIVICGITTNHCCETTARVGGNLGHTVLFALDATHTFDRAAPDGTRVSAAELARATATNLHGEFATVVHSTQLLGAVALRPISAAAAAAILDHRRPSDVRVADDHPTEFSEGVARQVGQGSPLGPFFIHRASDDMVVGEIGGGLVAPATAEIGYAVVPSCRGRGHATAAVRLLIERARASAAIERLIAHTPLDRPDSGRVLAKAGFRPVGEVEDEHEGATLRVMRWELTVV